MLGKENVRLKRASNNAPYPLEFKAEAVRLCRESGKALQQVADDLGVSSNSLREWVKRSDVAEGARPGLKGSLSKEWGQSSTNCATSRAQHQDRLRPG